jgi:hypothetical protein
MECHCEPQKLAKDWSTVTREKGFICSASKLFVLLFLQILVRVQEMISRVIHYHYWYVTRTSFCQGCRWFCFVYVFMSPLHLVIRFCFQNLSCENILSCSLIFFSTVSPSRGTKRNQNSEVKVCRAILFISDLCCLVFCRRMVIMRLTTCLDRQTYDEFSFLINAIFFAAAHWLLKTS